MYNGEVQSLKERLYGNNQCSNYENSDVRVDAMGRGAMMVVVDGWCDGFGWTENPTKAKKT